MTLSLFVTGTDTDCGKTRVACAILASLDRAGMSVSGMKPVATGATSTGAQLQHGDVKALIAASNVAIPRRYVNPYLFVPPCSPHIAAADTHTRIELGVIQEAFAACRARADAIVVEGAGGWYVPLADDLWTADMVRALGLPVVLVVGIRLGCINHAMLSARAILDSGAILLGWVGNVVEPSAYGLDAMIATMQRHLPAPCLALLPWAPAATAQDLAPAFAPWVEHTLARARRRS